MLDYLKSNGILTEKQFGFLSGRSTLLQLLMVMDKWMEILDKGGVIDVIHCDFQKAFDAVPHKHLIELRALHGFANPVFSWVQDFLSNQKPQILVNGCKSKIYDVTAGVTQGSVLGPLLFIIYINLLVEKSGSKDLFLYADYLKIFNEIKGKEDVESLQKRLDKLYYWPQYSLLKFHPEKCVVMRLMSKRKKLAVNNFYNMDENKLKIVASEKDLGVIFDDEPTFKEHNCKVKKANALGGMLHRSFTHLDKDMFKQLFVAIVRPLLEYGTPIWNPYSKDQITLIENVQRRATKQVQKFSDIPYKERLKARGLLTLQYRRY